MGRRQAPQRLRHVICRCAGAAAGQIDMQQHLLARRQQPFARAQLVPQVHFLARARQNLRVHRNGRARLGLV